MTARAYLVKTAVSWMFRILAAFLVPLLGFDPAAYAIRLQASPDDIGRPHQQPVAPPMPVVLDHGRSTPRIASGSSARLLALAVQDGHRLSYHVLLHLCSLVEVSRDIRHLYMDPTIGRFTKSDPAQADSINRIGGPSWDLTLNEDHLPSAGFLVSSHVESFDLAVSCFTDH